MVGVVVGFVGPGVGPGVGAPGTYVGANEGNGDGCSVVGAAEGLKVAIWKDPAVP